MNNTLSFTALDFNLMKPYFKSVLLLLSIGIIMSFFLKSTGTLSSYFMVMIMLLMGYPFAVNEKNGLDILYGTLPANRQSMVIGRYLFALALEVICAAATLLCSWLLSILLGSDFILSQEVFTLCLITGILYIIVALQYPVFFKFGYAKARLLSVAPMLFAFIVIVQFPVLANLLNFNFSWEAIFEFLMENPFRMYIAPILIGMASMALSCHISCEIYSKRDF